MKKKSYSDYEGTLTADELADLSDSDMLAYANARAYEDLEFALMVRLEQVIRDEKSMETRWRENLHRVQEANTRLIDEKYEAKNLAAAYLKRAELAEERTAEEGQIAHQRGLDKLELVAELQRRDEREIELRAQLAEAYEELKDVIGGRA